MLLEQVIARIITLQKTFIVNLLTQDMKELRVQIVKVGILMIPQDGNVHTLIQDHQLKKQESARARWNPTNTFNSSF